MSLDMVKKLQEQIEAANAKIEELATDVAERKSKKEVPSAASASLTKELRSRAANLHLLSTITGRSVDSISGFEEVKEVAQRAIIPRLPGVAGATDVPEWLAEQFARDIIERVQVMADMEMMFPKYTMPANTEVFSIPQKTDNTKAYLIAPAAEAVESAIASGKVSFQTKRLITFSIVSDQANAETIVALLDVVKQDMAESLVKAMENAIINGDTTSSGGTNINGATVEADAKDQTKAFDGLRKYAAANTVTFSDVPTFANLVKMRKQMGNYGVNLDDLVYIVSPSTYYNLLQLDEVVTMDKYGAQATVVTGEVAKVGGVPVVVSEYVPENLTAAGIVDDVTPGTATVILLVNKKFFAVADRGSIGFEQDRSVRTTSDVFVAYRDIDFKRLYTSTETACIGLDVTV